MRVVIEIEGTEVTAKTSQLSIETRVPSGGTSDNATSSGALDAGAAPTRNMGPDSPLASSQPNASSGTVPAANGDSMNAGTAPPLTSGQ
jgi:hypothetical protein